MIGLIKPSKGIHILLASVFYLHLTGLAMRYFTSFLLITLLILPALSNASTVYVTDSLQLKLRVTANTDGEVVTTLHSGQKLNLLEQQKKFSKVKTDEGETGWVQTWFLTDEVPATYLVNQLTKEKESLENKLAAATDKIKNFDSATARENKTLKNSIETLSNKINRLTKEQDTLTDKVAAQSSELAKYRFTEKYDLRLIVTVFFLIAFSVGFWAAHIWARTRERRRLSGYRLAH